MSTNPLVVAQLAPGLASPEDLAAFRPANAPADSAGQCSLSRTRGSGATRVTARFSARDSSSTTVTLWFDSAGSLVRYTEGRGSRPIRAAPTLTAAQRDSALRAGVAAQRMTFISLDFAVDEARASNTGGAGRAETITASVREMESLVSLGPPVARIRRVRQLCGV